MVREQFEGFDVEVVRDRGGGDFARAGNGPVLLEIVTYRTVGTHVRPREVPTDGELDEKKKSDPLFITLERLKNDFDVTDEAIQAITTASKPRLKRPGPSLTSRRARPGSHDYTYAPVEG